MNNRPLAEVRNLSFVMDVSKSRKYLIKNKIFPIKKEKANYIYGTTSIVLT